MEPSSRQSAALWQSRKMKTILYQVGYRHAERHFVAMLGAESGPLPRAADHFYRRFGGL
jgi:hypothetical protein